MEMGPQNSQSGEASLVKIGFTMDATARFDTARRQKIKTSKEKIGR